MTKEMYYEIIDYLISCTKYHSFITITHDFEELTRFSNNEVQQNIYKENINICIRIYSDNKTASINLNSTDRNKLLVAIGKVEELIKNVPPTSFCIPNLQEYNEIVDLKIDENINDVYNCNNRVKIIKGCCNLLNDEYKLFGSFGLNNNIICLGDSTSHKRFATKNYIEFKAIVHHESGASGFDQYLGKKTDLDFAEVFKNAYDKANLMINPIKLEPKDYTVILEPFAFGSLINKLSDIAFSAKSIQNNSSALVGKVDQKVFSEKISIADDVTFDNMIGFAIDYEGNIKETLKIIEQGIFKEVAHDLKSALAGKKKTTGHSSKNLGSGGYPSNLIICNGTQNVNDIIKSTKEGILITRLHYLNIVDRKRAVITGVTRDGTFLIKNGKIVAGIKDMRFTDSIIDILNKVSAISYERKLVPSYDGCTFAPAIKIENFKFTS